MAYGNTWRGLPENQLAEYVSRLEQRIRDVENKTFRIPVLEEDPSDGELCNMWAYEDGTINFRNSEGDIFQYHPYGTMAIPALEETPDADSAVRVWLNGNTGGLRIRGTNNNVANYAADSDIDILGSDPLPAKKPPVPKPDNPTKKKYVTTWTATWSESYLGSNSRRTDNNHLYYGQYDSRGIQKSLIGFNYEAIQDALAGSEISKVEFYLHNLHAFKGTGTYIKLGGHSNASRPGSYGGAVKNLVSSVKWGKSESGWKTISNWFGNSFRSGTIKGILFDPRSDSISYSGYAAGVSDGGYTPPKVRITYTK